MAKWLAAVLLVACAPKTITLLHTTDLHANVAAWDYLAAKPDAKRGLAKATSVIRAHRTPCSLVIDTGDALQGAPLGPEPMAAAMNRVGYSAMALGNHDFNFGPRVLQHFIAQAQFPVLAANVTGFNQWVMREVCGVQVAIIGLVTPLVRVWEEPEHITGLTFRSALAAAKELVPRVRNEGAQLVVIAIHAGPHDDGLPEENEAGLIAEQVPGVDAILSGHTHTRIPKLIVNGVIISQPHRWGSHVGETTIQWRRGVVGKDSRLLPVDEAAEAPDVLAAVQPTHEQTVALMATPIGEASEAFEGGDRARFKDSALADLINAAQMEAAASAGFAVDASGVAIFSHRATLAKGAVLTRDIYGIYPYDNTLWVLELKRDDFKAALEHDARFFKQLAGPLPPQPDDVKAPGDDFDWDLYAGIDYTIDLSKPPGDRVTLTAPPVLRVALNNYRANGGGGYAMLTRGKVLWRSQSSVRDMLMHYVKAHSPIAAVVTPNFRLRPDLYAHFFGRP